MLAKLCKNSIFPSPSVNQPLKNQTANSPTTNRNEYRLPKTNSQNSHSIQLIQQRQLPPPVASVPPNHHFNHQEPPPPYQKRVLPPGVVKKFVPPPQKLQPPQPQRVIPHNRSQVRSRVEEYRNRQLSDSELSDSERNQQRIRSRSTHDRRVNLPRQRSNEILLDEDLFCPDLVRNCKSLPVVEDDQDYIEIDELTSQLSLHNEVGLPTVEPPSSQAHIRMGQNLSNVKRPKLSLTWVLREQQQQQQPVPIASQSVKSFKWSEKTLFKKASKSHEKLFSEKYVNEDYRVKIMNDESKQTNSSINNSNNNVTRRHERMKRFHENCCRQQKQQQQQRENPDSNYDRLNVRSLSQANLSVKNVNNFTAEQSLYVTSAQSDSGVNRRYRRRRKKCSKFGYNINNINEFLSKCSLQNPANIPVVLSNASILYQTRTGSQVEIPLPLGMVVNSIFKNQNWLYVQTPHNEEGYVNFHACLPLGIIQRPPSSSTKCWETNTDIFPSPTNGNLTDSEKEIQLRGGTRSECGRRTPKMRKSVSGRSCSEKYLDSLYLLASQPKIIENSYAQLKPTNRCKVTNFNNFDKINGDYVQLKHYQEKKLESPYSTKRQMLLAITNDFMSEHVSLKKGDFVKLLACKEYEDKMFYFVKNSEGFECYIPSDIASEFL